MTDILVRLRNPPFGTETSERNLMSAAAVEIERLRTSLQAAIRAADLALFVIRKQGVMPNSSWEAGFEKDMAIARFGRPQTDADSLEGDLTGEV